MRSCIPVSIPVVEGSVEDAGEEQFLSGWFMAPNKYDDDDESETETEGNTNTARSLILSM